VVVMSSVACANGVVNAIGKAVSAAKVITHTEGCGRGPLDVGATYRTLTGLGKNPNVAAILVVGLGCEFVPAPGLAADIAQTNKPVEHLVIQENGGSRKTAEKGIALVEKFLDHAGGLTREPFDLAELTLGLECGGSDALSGITANPLVGSLSDFLVAAGGTAMLSETPEMIGAEHILARRAATPELEKAILELVREKRQMTVDLFGELAHMIIAPGNIEGGLSNIAEKSLGCIIKGGSTPLTEIVEYAKAPSKKGFVIMDTPGSDVFSITGMVAGGAQVVAFTTGRGNPVGFPIAPVIKVATNSELYNKMTDDMDINAGRLIEGVSMDEATDELVTLFLRVISGEETRAEVNQQDVLSIHTTGPSF
jgi:altronate dehydratase large subunit